MHIGDIRSATKDPLSTKLRWHLRKLKVDIDHPLIKILYSSEKVTAELAPLTKEQKAEPKEFGAVDNMRLRVLPVLGTMPAIMGQAIASYVLCDLGGKMFSPTAAERLGKQVRHRMLQHIKSREEKAKKAVLEGTACEGAVTGVEVDSDDIEVRLDEERRTARAKRQQNHCIAFLLNEQPSTRRFTPRPAPRFAHCST